MPRMWLIDPTLLCSSHLEKEHDDIHTITRLIAAGQTNMVLRCDDRISTRHIPSRHEALVVEMTSRGIDHSSPLPSVSLPRIGTIDKGESLRELMSRCPRCNRKIYEHKQFITDSFLTHQKQIENIAKAISRRYRFDEAELMSEAFMAFLEVHESRAFDPDKSSFSTWLQWKIRGRLLDLVRERAKRAQRIQDQDLLVIPDKDEGMLDYDSLSWDAQRIIRLIVESPRELLDMIMTRPGYRNPRSYRAALRQFLLDAGWLSKEIDRCFAELKDLFS